MLLAVPAVACLVGCGGGPTPASSPLSTPRGPSMRSVPDAPPQPRECPERYDDTNAERASVENVTAATQLVALARAGDRAALERSLSSVNSTSANELADLLRSISTACDPIWYAQPGRFAVQPAFDDEPPDPSRDALASAINAADHLVATCDSGCGVVALALSPDTHAVVAAMAISQRPGNQH
jgi:hypothetical protein